MKPALAFFAAWLVHLALATTVPPFADEAYYRFWATDLRLGYLDHPPGVAWWARFSRLGGVTLVPLGWWLLADAARRLGVAHWRWLPAVLMWTPLGAGAGFIVTPDAPLVFCWSLVLWAVVAERPVWVGVCFGLCLWSKSTALVALPGLVWVLRGRAVPALVVAAVVYAPHVWWSAHNEWLPWSFQAGHRSVSGFHLPEAVGGQLAVLTPGLFALAVLAWRHPADDVDRRLRALGLPVLAVWLAASCVTRIEANWPALAYPATAVLLLRSGHRWLAPSAVLGGLVTAGAAVFLALASPLEPVPKPREFRPVAARYQEMALLGSRVPYLRAAGHRVSEYDRRETPEVPACDFVYLADEAALAGRCRGVVTATRVAGRAAVVCRCVR